MKAGEQLVATCDSIRGEGATVTEPYRVGCVNCAVENKENVADDDAYTFASMHVDATGTGVALRSTAAPGTVFPAGSDAGAFYTPPAITSPTQVTVANVLEVRTYLGGVLQESDVTGDGHGAGVYTNDPDAPQQFRWIHTAKDFDAVEFVIHNEGDSGFDNTWKLHELCSNGWVYQPADW